MQGLGNPLTQKVNFYISIAFIASFGFIITVSVVQALNPRAALVQHLSSPITFDIPPDSESN